MRIGISESGYIPMRAGMSHKTEMLSEILFGELFEIQISRGDWAKVRLLHDDYEAWVDESQITYLEKDSETENIFKNKTICNHPTLLTLNNNEKILIPSGSVLPASHKKFIINNNHYKLPNDFAPFVSDNLRQGMLNTAISMLNTPYLWGGRTSWGTDCSGFSQFLYSLVGINIPRDASQQVNFGKTLSFISEAQPGDLAFFDNEEGIITHVGMFYESDKIIHASGKVRIDNIDHQGIYNKILKKYTHNLRVMKSLI